LGHVLTQSIPRFVDFRGIPEWGDFQAALKKLNPEDHKLSREEDCRIQAVSCCRRERIKQ